MTDLLTVKDLTYKKSQKTILNHLNLNLQPGKIVAMLGLNGAGKTSLMRVIAGEAQNWHGQVSIAGEEKAPLRKASLSFTDNLSAFRGGTRIKTVVGFYDDLFQDFDREEFGKMAAFMNIDTDMRLRELSRGMKEKVFIALTLARQTKLYLLDEPFSGIDPLTRKRIINSLLLWKNDQATIVISDHFVNEIASILDEVVIIKDRNVAAHRSTDDIRENGQSIEEFFESFYGEED